MVPHHRALPRVHRVRLAPPQTHAHGEVTELGILVNSPRVFGDVEPLEVEVEVERDERKQGG